MTEIILVRHGQTDWNRLHRIQGNCDIPLNKEGVKAAEKMAGELSGVNITSVYSSELSRSWETARMIAERHGLRVYKKRELNEIDQGVWQGLLVSDIKKRYKKQYVMWKSTPVAFRPPKGEGLKEAHDRALSCVRKIIARHKNETVCIVSHEVVITLLKCHFLNMGLEKMWHHVPKAGSWEAISV